MMITLPKGGSLRRYLLDGRPPRPDEPVFYERLAEHAFRSIDRAASEEESSGWVTARHGFDTRFAPESLWAPPYVILMLRIDRKHVPGTLLRAHVQQEEAAIASAEGIERLSAQRRREIRERIRSELLARSLPSCALHPIFWNVKRRFLTCFSTSSRVGEILARLFRETFGVNLVPATPVLLAESLRLDREVKRRIPEVTEASFVSAAFRKVGSVEPAETREHVAGGETP